MNHNLRIFGLSGSRKFAEEIADALDVELSPHTETFFEDGETFLKSDANVRGCDVYVIQSLYTDEKEKVGEKLTNLLVFVGSLMDASAKTINLVVPYLGYSRQDRKIASREPITTKYVAKVLQAVGIQRILSMDVHNLAAFQNSFYIPTDNLEAKNLIVDALVDLELENLAVLTPDAGGAVRAEKFRDSLAKRLNVSIDLAHHDKRRINGVAEQGSIIGDIKSKNVIIYDDMMSSMKTTYEAHKAVRQAGGKVIAACATHGMFVGKANEYMADGEFGTIFVTDTISPFRLSEENRKKVRIVRTARVFAKAIRRIHDGTGSISELLED